MVKWFWGGCFQQGQSSEKMTLCWAVLWHVHCNACVNLPVSFSLCLDLSISLSGIDTVERPRWANLSDFANLISKPNRLHGSRWRKKPFLPYESLTFSFYSALVLWYTTYNMRIIVCSQATDCNICGWSTTLVQNEISQQLCHGLQ